MLGRQEGLQRALKTLQGESGRRGVGGGHRVAVLPTS
nr:MAG TPA: hypothetical protein [Caudoviricetes sp.]